MASKNIITNSIGMKLRRVGAGSFLMGNDSPVPDELISPSCFRYGDFDERPVHRVTISSPFYLGSRQVTNREFEQFDPRHRQLRGKLGFSVDDDEAVVFVSWREASAFCRWLSGKEGVDYRLPTEAEWEYACRAGTTTAFSSGSSLPEEILKNQRRTWFPDEARTTGENIVSLHVGQGTPNPYGFYDMHGNVEEWCSDWYGPYTEREQVDPAGPVEGEFRIARGGSHSTDMYYLRSANRSAALPDERSWIIGFRVVTGGSDSPPRGVAQIEKHEVNVRQDTAPAGADGVEAPIFSGPNRYIFIPPESYGPMYSRHNHDASLSQCPNGDLLSIWYSCVEEPGRELSVLASRFRVGGTGWEPASVFWDAPDRNDHAPALWSDGNRLYHFNGMSAAATWGPLATILRISEDSGSTWSKARIIIPDHGPRHMPIPSVFALRDGTIVLPCDAVTVGNGGTALWMSEDAGDSWYDTGGTIAGIHASAVELSDTRLLAFGRGDEIDGRMAMSISEDRGQTWRSSASPFPPIGGGQRLVLKRISGTSGAGKDPLLFVSFATAPADSPEAYLIPAADGILRPAFGMFCAVSFDDGTTWPYRRALSDGSPDRTIETLDGAPCVMGPMTSEPKGYLAACQAADGMIHLISSTNHYTFNLPWLMANGP